jgi:hypothetical protein
MINKGPNVALVPLVRATDATSKVLSSKKGHWTDKLKCKISKTCLVIPKRGGLKSAVVVVPVFLAYFGMKWFKTSPS